MRHLFIINPAAGRPESTARLEALLSRLSFPHEVAYTREAGDAQRLAATAVRTGGPVRIYACGGDGTLNEVVNGAAGFDNAAVTCVPKGTGNDFLKLFGPRFRELFYDLEALAAGPQRAFDLMVLHTDQQAALKDAVETLGLGEDREYHDAGNDAFYTALIGAELVRRYGKLPTQEELGQMEAALRRERRMQAMQEAGVQLQAMLSQEAPIYHRSFGLY